MSFFYSHHPELQTQVNNAVATFAGTGLLVISGSTGVGKSFLAQLLHQAGPNNSEPLLSQDAAGLDKTRFESQLFGHVRGAFSGAVSTYAGLVGALGMGGTLVLEGIEDLNQVNQAKLLRFIQERVYRPVGAVGERRYGGRIILCCRAPLASLLGQGVLRDDFYFRIASSELLLPVLKNRPRDFDHLCRGLIADLASQLPPGSRLPQDAELNWLAKAPPDGNLHGLYNLFQQAMLRGLSLQQVWVSPKLELELFLPDSGSLKGDMLLLEGRLLMRTIEREGASSRAVIAQKLGISRRSLMYKLKQHRLNSAINPKFQDEGDLE